MFSETSAAVKAVAILITVLVIVGGIAGSIYYFSNLQADLAVSRENVKKLEKSVTDQQEAMETLRREQQTIKDINAELRLQNKLQDRDMENLRDRFSRSASGEKRDFGKTAAAKPLSVERAVNRATAAVQRCLEIASGAPLTEAEKTATKPSEINKECPSIANPAYKPTAGN